MADERKISERYRELPREEPPRRLDDAILAAARAGAPRKRRWYIPLAAAAVLVLAVAVAIQVDRGPPDREAVVSAPQQPSASAGERKEEEQAPKRESFKAESAPPRELQKAPSAESAAPPAAAARADARLSESVAGMAASPEQWLQGIIDLRRQARNAEADQQLAEFRRRYPDYRIDQATMEKLKQP